jgi:hypothetical protein
VADRPSVLFFHVDNLGFGELSCYSGGPFRGTWTGRVDSFDPHEREPISLPHQHSWTATHFNRLIAQFHASVQHEPLIPAGAPLDHRPST